MEFSKCLASQGLKITIILTSHVSKSAKVPPHSSISIEIISDGSEDSKEPESIEGFFKRFNASSLIPLELKDLPNFSFVADPNNAAMKLLADQFLNLDEADWIFINTFDKLENEVLNWMVSQWPFKTVGPTPSLMYHSRNS